MHHATLTPVHSQDLETAQRPIRVCHVSLGLNTGGLERLLVDFARFHDPEQTEMQFVALRDVGQPAVEIRECGSVVHELQARGGRFNSIRRLAKLFREIQPDIVHTHNAYPHFHATLAARWAGVPGVVHTRHGQRYGESWRLRWEFRLASRFADQIVAVSEDAARLSRLQDRIPGDKIHCIWNGIDTARFSYRGPADSPVAISVARLSYEKDFPTLLRAVRIALALVPNFKLRIVGDGGERHRLEQLAAELQLGSAVEFLGERRDIPELLSQAGFFVTSSLTEGISLTLLEAAAVGLPILATRVGGNPEIVIDGVTGRLVPSACPERLATGIVELCRLQPMWRDMGQQGRQRVLEHFDARQMIGHYELLYADLMKQKTAR